LAIEATSSRVGLQRLVRLRHRLTIWYVATFGLIIFLLGMGLFAVISYQLSQQLDDSLRSATLELVRAARIREMEAGARGRVVDAVDELNIPDRMLYLIDVNGNPVMTPHGTVLSMGAGTLQSPLGASASGSVLYVGDRRVVFVDLGDGRFAPRAVTLGAKAGDYYEVVSGLEAGEIVVTSGNFLIASESRLKSTGQKW